MNDPTLEQRIATLTATIDQLQAEQDRSDYALTFLLVAVAAVALLTVLEHRRLLRLIP